jgi:hypothetical protein
MELADFNAKTQEIISKLGDNADQGAVTNLLAELTTGFSEEIAAKNSATKNVETLTAQNAKLKEDNMNLFLRVTVPEEQLKNPVRPEEDKDPINKLFTNGRLNLKG